MTNPFPALADLPILPVITAAGTVDNQYAKQIGVYAIFDASQQVQYVGYSRNVAVSLLQHLVRQPQHCYGYAVYCIDRPDRPLLTQIQTQWLAAQPQIPPGNGPDQKSWGESLDVTTCLTPTEAEQLSQCDETERPKLLKTFARRLEAERMEALKARGLTQEIRFNPKLKAQGLLEVQTA